MSDYISRDAIGLTDFEIILCQADENKYKSLLVMLLDKIEKLPAADVREVIHCKDCVYSQAWYADRRICRLWNEEDGNSVFNDGYCNG